MLVGVIGCGYWGSKHVRVLESLPSIQQVVVIDSLPERRRAIQRAFPAVLAFEDIESALQEVEAIVIATPPTSHERLALAALEAGKHVLVEKPLATSVLGAQRILKAAEAASLTLMVGHTFEYNAAVWKLREVVQAGDLGDLHYVDTARLNLGAYQNDVNVVWDLAAHDVSIINYVLGTQPTVVRAWGSSHAHAYLEDVAYLRLDYSAIDVSAQVHVSWLDPCKVRRVTVVGSLKMAVYNDLADEERIRIYDKGVALAPNVDGLHRMPVTYRYGGIVSPYIEFHEPLAVEDAHFVDCIRSGSRPWTDGLCGLRVVEVLEAAGRSLREGRAVSLEPEPAPAW